ncbi:MAG: dihydroorotate dehydrogenase electron transfer subunit, partial [Candidatus Aminicenantaceae bacterium]
PFEPHVAIQRIFWDFLWGLSMKDIIIDPHAEIIEKTAWGDFVRLKLKSLEIAGKADPGQFLMVRVTEQLHPLLRRPLSIHDKSRDNIAIFFQITGTGTLMLSRKREGDCLDVMGPLGKGFEIPPQASGKSALVGGGRGIAPMIFLARRLRTLGHPFQIYYGARSRAQLPLKNELSSLILFCSTEDGTFGTPGLVTSLLENHCAKELPERIYACGPEAMLEEVSLLSQRLQIPAQLSLESVMGCGFGACWGCVKRLKTKGREGWYKICQKGPVIHAEDLVGRQP